MWCWVSWTLRLDEWCNMCSFSRLRECNSSHENMPFKILPSISCFEEKAFCNGLSMQCFAHMELRISHWCFYMQNACVLEQWTVPNVLSNTPRSELERCRFIYGDWASEEVSTHCGQFANVLTPLLL